MKKTKILIAQLLLLALLIFLSGCSGSSNIKNDFCGVHINYQYCKCAFHNEYCSNIGMSKSEANTYVYAEYTKWLESQVEEEYGIIEKDGKLYINSKPGEILKIKTNDLPVWAQAQLVVVGAMANCVGPPDTISSGDNNVLLNGLPVARKGDDTAHGGKITEGSTTIFVNGVPAAFVGGMHVCPMVTGTVPHVGGLIASTGY